MRKRRWLFLTSLTILLAFAAAAWLVPPILKAIPSRYVALLPAPVQALGERAHVDALPTPAAVANVESLLDEAVAEATVVPPPTGTAVPTVMAATSATLDAPDAADTSGAGVVEAEPDPTEMPPTPTLSPIPATARLTNIQHRFQDWNNCGPATLSMALSYFGLNVSQQETASVLKPNPEDRNVGPEEMAAFVREETDLDAIARTNGTVDVVRRLLAEGAPVIIELGIDPPGEYTWMGWYGHYLLVVAYDDSREQMWVYDSWFGTSETPGENANSEGRVMTYEELDLRWRQFNRSYIALFEPEKAGRVAEIIGSDMQDASMWQDALVRVQQELRAQTNDAYLWFNLGTVYNALGDFENAAIAYDQARAIGLPWRMLWYQFGPFEAYYQVGRYDDVIVLADITLQDRPYFEESYFYKGLALAALGELSEARANLERAVAFNPRFTQAATALAELE